MNQNRAGSGVNPGSGRERYRLVSEETLVHGAFRITLGPARSPRMAMESNSFWIAYKIRVRGPRRSISL
jgi:hypothetical protein